MDLLVSDSQAFLSKLNITDKEKVILISTDTYTDSTFLISHLMKQVFQDEDKGVCLLTLLRNFEHFFIVGRRLNYNLWDKCRENRIVTVEPLKLLYGQIVKEKNQEYQVGSENLIQHLLENIERALSEMLQKRSGLIYLVIDDITMLLDIGVEFKHIMYLMMKLQNFDERVNLIVNIYIGSSLDEKLFRALCYMSDVVVRVDPLRTGRSVNVTGALSVSRPNKPVQLYHYNATERGIRLFMPGESLYHLLN